MYANQITVEMSLNNRFASVYIDYLCKAFTDCVFLINFPTSICICNTISASKR